MKAEPLRNPARANIRPLELSERVSNLDTGCGRRLVDCHLLTGRPRNKLSQLLPPDILSHFRICKMSS